MVTAIHEPGNFTGKDLYDKARETADNAGSDLKVIPKVYEMALQRALDQAATDKNYDSMMELLKDTAGGFNITILPSSEARSKFQEREVTRFCCSLLAEENRVAEVEKLLAVVLGPSSCLAGDSSIRKEFEMLRTLLRPMDLDIEIQILERNALAFQQDKNLSLHKVMTNFPTGLVILDSVSVAVVARRTDLEQQTKLHEIVNDVNAMQRLPEDVSLDGLGAALQPIKDISKKYFEASSSVSSVFRF